MFTKSDLKPETIDGQKYITFHPNTLVYAVPFDSELGSKIRNSNIGIVWHTTYSGDSFESLSASFGKTIVDKMGTSSKVWMDDATYKDYSGTATFTEKETKDITKQLSDIGKLFHTVSAECLNTINKDSDLLNLILTYNNSKIRANERVTNIKAHVKGLYSYIHDKYQKEIDTKKTEKGKAGWEEKRTKILSFFDNHPIEQIERIFELSYMIADVKQPIIDKMNKASSLKTFVKTTDGFRVTGSEGYVAIDTLSNNAVKIVDRMEFSRSNFDPTVLKGWQR